MEQCNNSIIFDVIKMKLINNEQALLYYLII